MGRSNRAGERHQAPGIYAHRLLDEGSVSVFQGVQDAIASAAGNRRFRPRSDASAGVSLMTSARMRKILDDSPELRKLGTEVVAAKMRSAITTGRNNIPLRVIGTGIISTNGNYLVAYVMHPDILKDQSDLVRTLRGLGGVSLGGNELGPHVTFAAFYGNIPGNVIKAVENNVPNSFTVGPAQIDELGVQRQSDQPQTSIPTRTLALGQTIDLQERFAF